MATIVVDTITGTRNNAQSGHTFMITFFGSDGHSVPAILSNGFENGASDSFTFNIGDIGTFYAAKISNTEIMMTCPAEFATCTADNTDFEPQTEDECASAATALGLELGGQGYSFAGSYSTGGCYSYFSGTYAGHAYWSTGSSGLGSSKYRVQTQCSTQIAAAAQCTNGICVATLDQVTAALNAAAAGGDLPAQETLTLLNCISASVTGTGR